MRKTGATPGSFPKISRNQAPGWASRGMKIIHTMNSNILKENIRLPLLGTAAGAAALLSVLALSSGCVVAVRPAPVVYEQPVGAPGEVVVSEDPPAPVYETVGIAPGPGYLWIGGYYHWSGAGWVWYRGHY